MKTFPGGWVDGLVGGLVGGWLENEFLKKTPSPKFGLGSLLGTFDFGVCQKHKADRNQNAKRIRTKLKRIFFVDKK